jgi:hypothetical protein
MAGTQATTQYISIHGYLWANVRFGDPTVAYGGDDWEVAAPAKCRNHEGEDARGDFSPICSVNGRQKSNDLERW